MKIDKNFSRSHILTLDNMCGCWLRHPGITKKMSYPGKLQFYINPLNTI